LPIRVGSGYDAPVVDLQASRQRIRHARLQRNPPLVFVGEQVRFADLKLTRLREIMPAGWDPDAGIKAESFQCPGCGSSLTIRAKGHTETLACGTCGSIIDLTDPISASCPNSRRAGHARAGHSARRSRARWKAWNTRPSAICGGG
jgi:ribosomal protein S27AE